MTAFELHRLLIEARVLPDRPFALLTTEQAFNLEQAADKIARENEARMRSRGIVYG